MGSNRTQFGLINGIICVLLMTPNLGLSVALSSTININRQYENECDFPAIFNFGDSNSDTGGLSAVYGQAPPPYGKTFFGAPAGRYCDGRLIIDFLGGVFRELLPKEDYFTRALYTFDIGQNDLTAGYKLNMTSEQVKAYIPDVLHQFSKVVKGVYGQGGRSFWIHNTGPLGCLPYMLDRFNLTAVQIDQSGCAIPLNEVSRYYNSLLKEVVVQLRMDLPLAAITYVDIYSLKYTLITQAKKYGFDKPLVACCGIGGRYNYNNTMRCGSTEMVGGKDILIAKSCNNPSARVNWDGIHYTEAANKWLFDQITRNSLYLDPPISLEMACHKSK